MERGWREERGDRQVEEGGWRHGVERRRRGRDGRRERREREKESAEEREEREGEQRRRQSERKRERDSSPLVPRTHAKYTHTHTEYIVITHIAVPASSLWLRRLLYHERWWVRQLVIPRLRITIIAHQLSDFFDAQRLMLRHAIPAIDRWQRSDSTIDRRLKVKVLSPASVDKGGRERALY
eukprot:1814801-Rhodomonas_salina.1